MTVKLSDLSRKQLKAIDDIQAIMNELKKNPINITDIPEKDKEKLAALVLEVAARSYDAGYNAAKEE